LKTIQQREDVSLSSAGRGNGMVPRGPRGTEHALGVRPRTRARGFRCGSKASGLTEPEEFRCTTSARSRGWSSRTNGFGAGDDGAAPVSGFSVGVLVADRRAGPARQERRVDAGVAEAREVRTVDLGGTWSHAHVGAESLRGHRPMDDTAPIEGLELGRAHGSCRRRRGDERILMLLPFRVRSVPAEKITTRREQRREHEGRRSTPRTRSRKE